MKLKSALLLSLIVSLTTVVVMEIVILKTLQPVQKQIITKPTYTSDEIGRLIAGKIAEKYERLIPDRVLQSSIVTDKYSAVIRNINIYKGEEKQDTERFQYNVELNIHTSDGLGYSFFWNKKDIDNTSVFDLVKGKKIPLAMEDLHIGDQIVIEVTLDLLKNPKDNMLNNSIVRIK